MNELELGRALRSVRAELSPAGGDKARLRAALGLAAQNVATGLARGSARAVAPGAVSPGAVAPGGTAAAAAPLTRGAALRASGKLGIGVGALVFAAGMSVGLLSGSIRTSVRGQGAGNDPAAIPPTGSAFTQQEPAGQPLPRPLPLPVNAAATNAAAQTPSPMLPEAARAPSARGAHPRAAPHAVNPTAIHPTAVQPAAVDPLAEELALLRRVERALRANDPALALALLGELDRRFPETRLAEEREAAHSMADCRRREPNAWLQAQAFLRAHPTSVYSERVQLACAQEKTANGAQR